MNMLEEQCPLESWASHKCTPQTPTTLELVFTSNILTEIQNNTNRLFQLQSRRRSHHPYSILHVPSQAMLITQLGLLSRQIIIGFDKFQATITRTGVIEHQKPYDSAT